MLVSGLHVLVTGVLFFFFNGTVASGSSLVNVALRMPTQQIDTFGSAVSDLAVDGNFDTTFERGSCSHTLEYGTVGSTWWGVDLLWSYPIHSVRITNRISERDLRDFYVYVADMNPFVIADVNSVSPKSGVLCHSYEGNFPLTDTISCSSVTYGRYVYIWKPGDRKLCLCEVEIMAEAAAKRKDSASFYNVQKGGWRSKKTPFKSTSIKRVSKILCVSFCMSATEGVATIVQLNNANGLCECVQKSPFESPNPGNDESPNPGNDESPGWILMVSSAN